MTDIKQAQAAYSHDEYVKEVMADPLKAIAYLKHTYKENATTMACALSVEKALKEYIEREQETRPEEEHLRQENERLREALHAANCMADFPPVVQKRITEALNDTE